MQKELGTTGHAVSVGTFSDTSQAKVEHAIAGRTSPPRLVLRAGEFPATFVGLEDRQWRFILRRRPLRAHQSWPGDVLAKARARRLYPLS